jgi:hypothetical protein|tara:strand:+ start:571 stop:888 length:318 start_codon:yes stop_codon:yes gene_type:complete
MKKGDIVTVVTISGEYVGVLESTTDAGVAIEDPRMILSNPNDGSMGFAKGLAATGQENPPHAIFQQVVFVVPTAEHVADAHMIATGKKEASKIEVPAQKKIIAPK